MMQHRHTRPFLVFFLMISALSLALAGQAATKIYKTVDAEGNVVFTDVAPKEGEDAKPVAVEATNTFEPEATSAEGRQPWNVDQADNPQGDVFSYTSVAIVSPGNDDAVRENAGNVAFDVDVEPDLQPGDKVRLLLDGKPEQEGPQLSFLLTNIDRGTHSANVEIVDNAGKVLKVSSPIIFHMMRVAVGGQPPRPTPHNNSN